jgi:hypothetical protein
MKDIVTVVNFVRSQVLNHRESQNFLTDVEAEYSAVSSHTS